MGFIDIISAMPRLVFIFYKLLHTILKLNPKVCIFIDYPGFNLRLERALKKRGYKGKLIHYVSPTVWAWSKGRIPMMAENLDHLLTIFPFESKCYAHTPLKVSYVGNPLVHKVKSHLPKKTFASARRISLFPGSRQKEIERNLPQQIKALESLESSGWDFALSISSEKYRPLIEKIVSKSALKIELIEPKDSYDLMQNTYLAIATSGTVTLELALHNVPTVVTFAVRPIDLFIVRRILKIDLPFYCIVNIIQNEEVFPELFGPNLSINKLSYYVTRFLSNEKAKESCCQKLEELRAGLESDHPAKKAAKIISSEVHVK